jgi:hypothetical protein
MYRRITNMIDLVVMILNLKQNIGDLGCYVSIIGFLIEISIMYLEKRTLLYLKLSTLVFRGGSGLSSMGAKIIFFSRGQNKHIF